MISSEVQRTLVKSPPELWAELSDPASLARHLGELGEIRIVRTEPESTVEWTAPNTTGTVSIKPSGWGTKVTLSVTRELAAQHASAPDARAHARLTIAEAEPPATVGVKPPAAADSQPQATTAATPPATATAAAEHPTAADSQPQATAAAEPPATVGVEPPDTSAAEPPATAAAEPPAATKPPATAEPASRRGLFAWLFGRRQTKETVRDELVYARTAVAQPASAPAGEQPADPPAQATAPQRPPERPDAFAAVRKALEPETFATKHPFAALPEAKAASAPAPPMQPRVQDIHAEVEQPDDISAELMAAEELGAEEVTKVLTAVLDRLGAAHHRPFSRA